MNYRDEQICQKLREENSVIYSFLEGVSEQDFLNDERTKRAVSMTLINIGELVKK